MNLVGMKEGGKESSLRRRELPGEKGAKERIELDTLEIRDTYRKERGGRKERVLEYDRDEIERGGRKGDTESDREEIGRREEESDGRSRRVSSNRQKDGGRV